MLSVWTGPWNSDSSLGPVMLTILSEQYRNICWPLATCKRLTSATIGCQCSNIGHSNSHSYGQCLKCRWPVLWPMFERADVHSYIGSRCLKEHCRRTYAFIRSLNKVVFRKMPFLATIIYNIFGIFFYCFLNYLPVNAGNTFWFWGSGNIVIRYVCMTSTL